MKKLAVFLICATLCGSLMAGEMVKKVVKRNKSAGADLEWVVESHGQTKTILKSAMITSTNASGLATSVGQTWTVYYVQGSITNTIGSSGADPVTNNTTIIYFEAPVYLETIIDGVTNKIVYTTDDATLGAYITESLEVE